MPDGGSTDREGCRRRKRGCSTTWRARVAPVDEVLDRLPEDGAEGPVLVGTGHGAHRPGRPVVPRRAEVGGGGCGGAAWPLLHWLGTRGGCRRTRRKPCGMRAVAAVRAGRERREVAELLGVSAESVADWWAAWQAGGREALVSGRRGRRVGEHQVLGPDQQQCAIRARAVRAARKTTSPTATPPS
ncbi:helix-turn-helix domain-containing protein [Kitasatospora sp. NPDC048545]|uniref:helix-turn-helix domain-containing protein n=1 Tax=Kitasatospora sp. NPDC048545 TaxID=3157208 RepID=UPI0033F278ED